MVPSKMLLGPTEPGGAEAKSSGLGAKLVKVLNVFSRKMLNLTFLLSSLLRNSSVSRHVFGGLLIESHFCTVYVNFTVKVLTEGGI